MTAFLVIILIVGNLFLLSGSIFNDLADNPIAWFIVLGAIAADIYLIYLIYKSISESKEEVRKQAEKTRIAALELEVNKICETYKPKEIMLFEKAKQFITDSQIQNRELISTVKAYKQKVQKLSDECSLLKKQIEAILNCPNCHNADEKYNYLVSNQSQLDGLKYELDLKQSKIKQRKILLLNEDKDLLVQVNRAFMLLRTSQKCVSEDFNVKEVVLIGVEPVELSLFKYKYKPVVLFVNGFYFCLFSNVILVFDENGRFSSAIDTTAIKITTTKLTDRICFYNDRQLTHKYIDSDSKFVEKGETTHSWQYTRRDGMPDMRYSYNPLNSSRWDTYEFGEIVFEFVESNVRFTVSSYLALETFEKVVPLYIRKHNNKHNSIPEYLRLIDVLSCEKDSNIKYVIEKYNGTKNNQNYFCKEIME